MKILVINAGSSSLKYQLFDMDKEEVLAKGLCERIGIEGSQLKHQPKDQDTVIISNPMKNHADAIRMVIDALVDPAYGVIKDMSEITAVGHRVVHGGEAFSGSVIIDAQVMKVLNACIDLAPLHNPPNIIGIEACKEAMPGVPMVGVFDTAFHQTMPPEAYLYAIPYELYEKHKIRKYGFHGTSHKYVAERAAKLLKKPIEQLKIITCHLGNGSSITAVKNGKSVDTSMGFTPLAGVAMGTRSGMIDPAIVTFLMEKENLSIKEVNDLLNKKSGVLGISGVSSDFRDIHAAADEGNKRARLALDIFAYSVKKYIGTYAAIMGGVDAIVFTAGIGENNAKMRTGILSGLEFMGIKIDEEKNAIRGKEIDISTPDASVRTLVIPTNEELMIALDTKKLVENMK
ncbi:acetate/propionate family kinase [Petroclostridium xylanilyticum]|uniref:acetate/propionate family kinase n=1 Tax=Petroclostridium xylanilyticum TaxID=1792311 RepID=UPI000B99B8EE|nr:acetate kinase [Petroclostridium xylanilyticum]